MIVVECLTTRQMVYLEEMYTKHSEYANIRYKKIAMN